jgi:ribose transport system permease protein
MNKSLATSGEEITGRPGLLGRVRWRSLAIVLPFLVIFIAVSIGSPSFLKPVNLLNILDQQSSILIIAAAGTIVLITGGIDLSVGATYALSSVVAGTLAMTQGPIVAILAGLAVGALVGLVNGVVSTILKINALIATLAMSFIALGFASLVTGGNLIVLYDHPDFGVIAKAKILGVQSAIWIAIIVVVVLVARFAAAGFPPLVTASAGDAGVVDGRNYERRARRKRGRRCRLAGTRCAAGGTSMHWSTASAWRCDTCVLSRQLSPGQPIKK